MEKDSENCIDESTVGYVDMKKIFWVLPSPDELKIDINWPITLNMFKYSLEQVEEFYKKMYGEF